MNEYLSVILVPTLRCNCTCEHCFELLDGEEMSETAFDAYLKQIRVYALDRGVRYLVFNWQGGDILCMSPSQVIRFMDISKETFQKDPFEVHHILQTNLIGYSKTWRDIIKKYFSGRLGTSLDFPNVYRKTPTVSKEAYAAVWLQKKNEAEADGITVSIISVPSAQTLDAGGVAFYRYYKETIGARAVQLNLPFPGEGTSVDVALNREKLEHFVNELHRKWVLDPEAMPISPFAVFLSRIKHGRGRIPCIFSKSCAESFFCLSPSGDVGQCDAWVAGFRDFNFGNLGRQPLSELLMSEKRMMFVRRPMQLLANTPCGECEFWRLCHGGCPIRAYAFTNDINTPDDYCSVYKTFFSQLLSAFGSRIFKMVE